MRRTAILLFPAFFFMSSCKPRDFNNGEAEVESNPSVSAAKPSASAIKASCDVLKLRDPYTPTQKIPTGRSAGMCYDTDDARPIKILKQDSQVWQIANVSHLGGFYTAKIPVGTNAVKEFIYEVEWFQAAIPAAHGQLRVTFNKEISLEPQGAGTAFKTDKLIFSMEALAQRGWKFDIVQGVLNSFGAVWRVKTFEDFVVQKGKAQGPMNQIDQALLSLENYPQERVEIVKEWLNRSNTNGLSKMYNTVSQSCAMEAFNVIEVVRQRMSATYPKFEEDKAWPQSFWRARDNILKYLDTKIATPGEIYPPLAMTSLKNRKYFSKDLPVLHEDPAAQAVWKKHGIHPTKPEKKSFW